MKQEVFHIIDQNQDRIVGFLRQLISFPSVTGNEGDIQRFLATEIAAMGLEVEMLEPDWEALKQHPDYVPVKVGYEGRPNVVAILRGKGGGRSLLFNGHVDVIPPGAPDSWDHEPFHGTVVEGKVYGRGASDMKAGLTAFTMAVWAVVQSGAKLRGDLQLHYVVDEELSGNGTLDLVRRGYRADAGICCETSSMAVQPGSVGRIWFEIAVRGKAAGIQRRYEGVNAIDKGYLVTRAVSAFERVRLGKVSHPLYPNIIEAIPCMVGAFESGTYHSAFPDTALLKGSLATVPGEDSDAVKAEFREFVLKMAAEDPWLRAHPPSIEFTGYFAEPSAVDVASPIVQELCKQYKEVMGVAPKVSGRQGAADIRFLNRPGGTPTVIFGPGMTEQMHANNEWAPVSELVQATKILAATILDWCGIAG
jgi:acetylornithine deacetylase